MVEIFFRAVERLLSWLPPLRRTFEPAPSPRAPGQLCVDRALALSWGVACHLIFGLAVAAMIAGMWLGMQAGLGVVPQPWAWAVNLLLLLQFPLGHSILLSAPGRRVLSRLAPAGRGPVLATTTYALIASLQLLSIFALWTPSGIVWWQAEGWVLWAITGLYAGAWLLLMKASWDAGAEVQSGLLGWVSLLRGVTPRFPPMPVTGLFRLIRQPIYVSFALTTWLVPVWTPDQLLTASVLTAYCALGPLLKERRFDRLFGAEWRAYRAVTPYWIPRRTRPRGANQDGSRGADLAGAVRPR